MDYFLSFKINNREFNFDVQSKSFKRGENVCMYTPGSVYSSSELFEEGYVIKPFPKDWYTKIHKSMTDLVGGILNNPQGFSLEKYHQFVNDETHMKVVKNIQGGIFGIGGIHLNKLGIDYKHLDEYINDTIKGNNLSCNDRRLGNLLSLKYFWIRIVRPNSIDNNPPHKDTHFKRIRNNVNIYLPLVGSNQNSSLPLIPKSHVEMESDYIVSDSPCYVNGRRFRAPAIVHRKNGLNFITPNPKKNEIMIFDPHIVHGGGINSNKNTTRVSLEMRFYKYENWF